MPETRELKLKKFFQEKGCATIFAGDDNGAVFTSEWLKEELFKAWDPSGTMSDAERKSEWNCILSTIGKMKETGYLARATGAGCYKVCMSPMACGQGENTQKEGSCAWYRHELKKRDLSIKGRLAALKERYGMARDGMDVSRRAVRYEPRQPLDVLTFTALKKREERRLCLVRIAYLEEKLAAERERLSDFE